METNIKTYKEQVSELGNGKMLAQMSYLRPADFEDTCKLMRKYIEQNRPQSFASVWGIFEKQKKQCELNKISIDDVSDIYNYAKVEQIEKFGF